MKSKYCKLIISLILVVALFCSFASPAHALSYSAKQRIGAWISSALMALNVYTQAGVGQELKMLEFLGDPIGLTYTYEESQVANYFDQSVIQVWPDYVTIDGVEYTDIWISHDVADKFRVNAGDFITANQIVSNSNGTFASGYGYVDGTPFYHVPNQSPAYQSATYTSDIGGTYPFGNGTVRIGTGSGTTRVIYTGSNGVQYGDGNNWFRSPFYWRYESNNPAVGVQFVGGGNPTYNQENIASGLIVSDPFDFDYTSQVIPDTPLPQDDGLMLRVPSSDAQDIIDYVDENPEFKQDGGYEVDISLPGVEAKLNDLFDLIVPLVPIIDSFNTVNHSEPAPTYDTISNTYYDVLETQLNDIMDTISNAFDTFTETFQDAIDSIIETLGDILDKILEDIEIGPIKVFDKALDILKTIFAPILLLLKNALGIWHYVVTWVGNISTCFSWFFGVLSGSGSIFVAPIYACIAGTIVIAVYKRFGR